MQLFNEDCLQAFKRIPDESIDCVLTDCPYHIVSGGCTKDPMKIGNYSEMKGVLNHRPDGNDSTTYTRQGKLFKFNEIEFKDWLPEVYRVLKNDTHCYVMINARNLKDLWQCAEDAGFMFQQLLVWDKGNLTPNKYYMNAYELVLMLRKGKARNINNMGSSNILRVPNVLKIKKHPTEKPTELMQVMIENSTNVGDVVLDPFMGVGGVGVACKNSNRDFIGIEIDEKYFVIAEERINGITEEKQMTIFDYL